MSIESQLPAGLQTPVDERLQAAAKDQVVRRLWDRDGTLWAPEGTPEVTDRLGWLDIAERLSAEADDLRAFAAEVRDAGITDAVLLGMGGSAVPSGAHRVPSRSQRRRTTCSSAAALSRSSTGVWRPAGSWLSMLMVRRLTRTSTALRRPGSGRKASGASGRPDLPM